MKTYLRKQLFSNLSSLSKLKRQKISSEFICLFYFFIFLLDLQCQSYNPSSQRGWSWRSCMSFSTDVMQICCDLRTEYWREVTYTDFDVDFCIGCALIVDDVWYRHLPRFLLVCQYARIYHNFFIQCSEFIWDILDNATKRDLSLLSLLCHKKRWHQVIFYLYEN